jgi:hypothetical protein
MGRLCTVNCTPPPPPPPTLHPPTPLHMCTSLHLLLHHPTPDPSPPCSPPGAVHLQVLHDDDHIAVVVKPFGVKCYGRGRRSVKHVLPGHLAPSMQGGARREAA